MLRTSSLLRVLMLLMIVALFGCSDDTTSPSTNSGKAVVSCTPGSLDAPWILSLPDGLSARGEGDGSVSKLEPGYYVLTWQDVDGWVTPFPNPVSKKLVLGATISYKGTYRENDPEAGTLNISVTPEDLAADWILTGPDDYLLEGIGASQVVDLVPGDYEITWMDVETYSTPAAAAVSLGSGETEILSGVYLLKPGTIRINVTPTGSNPAWTLAGPGGDTPGTGNATLSDMAPGSYTITWSSLPGRITPAGSSRTLAADGVLGFTGNYIETAATDGLIRIPAGTFAMGSPVDETDRDPDETLHTVTLSGAFYMKPFEVTNQEYMTMLQWAFDQGLVSADQYSVWDDSSGTSYKLVNLSSLKCDISYGFREFRCDNPQHPVIEITWYGAASYCNWLNLRAGMDPVYDRTDWSIVSGDVYAGSGYRLPTEAEWEYACRAGTDTRFNTGDCLVSGEDANYMGAKVLSDCTPSPDAVSAVDVGSFLANDWGLHDMHGNAFEWCSDGDQAYPETAVTNPLGVGDNRMVRGGSWGSTSMGCRSANRYFFSPGFSNPYVGFRVVRNAD